MRFCPKRSRSPASAIAKATVFALGIMPYISASIILQLLTVVIPHLEQLKKDGFPFAILSDLDSRFTQQEIRTVYGENDWQCGSQQTAFGDSLCVAKIGTFNGFPARLVTFYFHDDNVSALKLVYRDQYHKQIMGYIIGEFGQPTNVESAIAAGPDADSVLEWDLGKGVLLIKKELGKTDEPSLLWLAGRPAS